MDFTPEKCIISQIYLKYVFKNFESIFDCSEAVYDSSVTNIFQIGGQSVSIDRITNSLLNKRLIKKCD